MRSGPAVLAADGGNSKTDLALVSRGGALLALVRGPTISHQQVALDEGMERLTGLVAEAGRQAGLAAEELAAGKLAAGELAAGGLAEVGCFCLAGADFPSDLRLLTTALRRQAVARRVMVRNDGFAALRAGASRGWGVALICGAGVNAVGMAPDGGSARLAGVGDLSGDWGGGQGIGMTGLGAAVRARDGRGARTSLATRVPAHFGLVRPIDVTRALYEGRLGERRVEEITPLVFAEAAKGDRVSRDIVDRLADELTRMAVAIGRRLRLVRREPEVVLAGSVFATSDAAFFARLDEGIRRGLPGARLTRLDAPPVLGAALLGLDELDLPRRAAAEARLRSETAAAVQLLRHR